MPPSPTKPLKLSPTKGKKKKKVAVKADYGGVFFGAEEPASSRAGGEDPELPEDDPMASYRAAAAAAAKALAKERKDEASTALYKKIFTAMDTDGDGKVDMADMVEKIVAGTSQLSQRAASGSRPDGAVALQLPMTFGLDEWIKEMRRVSGQMDEPTFEANVLGLFACFDEPAAESARAPDAEKLDRTPLLKELFAKMDSSNSGTIDLDDFLTQARTSEEAEELKTLFHFLDTTYGKNSRLDYDAFAEGVLSKTPLGRMRDKHFASAIRGMIADVAKAVAAKKRLGLLHRLFSAMDIDKKGVVEMDAFLTQAKSSAEKEELKESFAEFDATGVPDGKLTFRKFATGTMQTPLGRLKEDAFEQAVTGMISSVNESRDGKATAAADLS